MEKNILGTELQVCSTYPLTGFFRDGCCRTSAEDTGTHTVCAIMTREFLEFSLERGNDLITPREEWHFPGLKPGDRWCLCALRWLEAYRERKAPTIIPEACHISTLKIIPLEILSLYSIERLN